MLQFFGGRRERFPPLRPPRTASIPAAQSGWSGSNRLLPGSKPGMQPSTSHPEGRSRTRTWIAWVTTMYSTVELTSRNCGDGGICTLVHNTAIVGQWDISLGFNSLSTILHVLSILIHPQLQLNYIIFLRNCQSYITRAPIKSRT